jgi:ligand-binding sensor domain-containing protein
MNGQNKGLGDLIINPNNPNQLHVATNTGLFTTSNAGASWIRGSLGNFTQGNVRLKTNDPNTVFAVSTNRFFRSTNSGTSFSEITTGLPLNSSRMVMDVTAADPNYVYILCFSSQTSSVNNGFLGLYRSTDAGTSFQLMNDQTNVLESTQGWYDLALCASPTNRDLIFTGCLNVWSSLDGGASFVKVNNWSQPSGASYTHADIHYLGYKGTRLFCGSDGGIYFSQNDGQSFTDKTATAQIGQFYKISVSPNTDGKIAGGLQDNGGFGFSNNTWKNWYGADGMDNAINPTNDNIFYGLIQYGTSLHISTTAANSRQGSAASPGNIQGRWVTPMVINNTGQLFSGFNRLYRFSGTTSGTWLQQSNNLFSTNISDIAIHPQDNNIIYLSVSNQLYKSVNLGIDFELVYTFTNTITSIAPHQTNLDIVYATTTGSSGNRVFKSIDGGFFFANFSEGLPTVAINVIKHHKNHINDAVYVGTALGVYYRDNITNTFVNFDTNLPNVAVRDIEVYLPTNKLIAATYGRGVWTTDLMAPLSTSTFDQANIAVYPNPFEEVVNVNSANEIPSSIKIYDFSGKLVFEQYTFISDKNQIDSKSLSCGIYLMKIAFANKIVSRKIIKK